MGLTSDEKDSIMAMKLGFQNIYKLIMGYAPQEDITITSNRCQAILDIVTPTLNSVGVDLIQGVGTGTIAQNQVLEMMQRSGGNSFKSQEFLASFGQFYPRFDMYIKEIHSALSSYVPVECDECGAEYDVDPTDFSQSHNNICGAQTANGGYCKGTLKSITNERSTNDH